jgi:hypothetical protein
MAGRFTATAVIPPGTTPGEPMTASWPRAWPRLFVAEGRNRCGAVYRSRSRPTALGTLLPFAALHRTTGPGRELPITAACLGGRNRCNAGAKGPLNARRGTLHA